MSIETDALVSMSEELKENKDMTAKISDILRDPFPLSIYPQLSQLERSIAKMTVIDGMTAQEIADALGSSKSTVNSYRRTVFKASGARPHEWAKVVFDRIRKALGDTT